MDDHTVVRRGLRRILDSHADIAVVGEANDGEGAVSAAIALSPDVVVMDVALPRMNGIEATRQILQNRSSMRVLMLSMYGDAQYVEQSRAAGAHGYLLKDADYEDVVAAVIAVAQGQLVFRPMSHVCGGDGCAPVPDVLSARERAVLALISAGASNRQVAEQLEISVNTVESHRKHIIEKLDLHSTADLVRYAIRNGIASAG